MEEGPALEDILHVILHFAREHPFLTLIVFFLIIPIGFLVLAIRAWKDPDEVYLPSWLQNRSRFPVAAVLVFGVLSSPIGTWLGAALDFPPMFFGVDRSSALLRVLDLLGIMVICIATSKLVASCAVRPTLIIGLALTLIHFLANAGVYFLTKPLLENYIQNGKGDLTVLDIVRIVIPALCLMFGWRVPPNNFVRVTASQNHARLQSPLRRSQDRAGSR